MMWLVVVFLCAGPGNCTRAMSFDEVVVGRPEGQGTCQERAEHIRAHLVDGGGRSYLVTCESTVDREA